jgi:glycosyltransferase involved in cell wall biosynthesis
VSEPLRIAMIAPFGIRPKGTLSARMLPLAKALTRRGHTVSIAAPPVQNPADAGTRALHGGVWVTHAPAARLPGGLDWAPALLRLALRERPDVLHLFKPKGYGGLAALLARALRPGLPLVVDTDDWEGRGGWNDLLPYPAPAKALFNWQERDLPRRAHAVTVASRTLQAQVWENGANPASVFYIPNGVEEIRGDLGGNKETRRQGDKEIALHHTAGSAEGLQVSRSPGLVSPGLPPSPTMLLYTRFWEFDVRDVVAALVAIAQGCPRARLLVIGKGERGEERRLLALAERAGVARAVDYRGWAEPGEIPALMAQCDLALAPMDDTLINRARGLAKLLELMGAGLPIVASRVGQAAEYITHERSGLLVPPADPGALAGAALRLLADAALRERLGRGALAALAPLRWDALAETAEAAYRAALRGARRP